MILKIFISVSQHWPLNVAPMEKVKTEKYFSPEKTSSLDVSVKIDQEGRRSKSAYWAAGLDCCSSWNESIPFWWTEDTFKMNSTWTSPSGAVFILIIVFDIFEISGSLSNSSLRVKLRLFWWRVYVLVRLGVLLMIGPE